MISYSTNWMGPVSTKWYEDRNIPEGIDYSGGRIDIYGLDEEEHWGGKSEYDVRPMRTEDWNDFGDWLDHINCKFLVKLDTLIHLFEITHKRKIRWAD